MESGNQNKDANDENIGRLQTDATNSSSPAHPALQATRASDNESCHSQSGSSGLTGLFKKLEQPSKVSVQYMDAAQSTKRKYDFESGTECSTETVIKTKKSDASKPEISYDLTPSTVASNRLLLDKNELGASSGIENPLKCIEVSTNMQLKHLDKLSTNFVRGTTEILAGNQQILRSPETTQIHQPQAIPLTVRNGKFVTAEPMLSNTPNYILKSASKVETIRPKMFDYPLPNVSNVESYHNPNLRERLPFGIKIEGDESLPPSSSMPFNLKSSSSNPKIPLAVLHAKILEFLKPEICGVCQERFTKQKHVHVLSYLSIRKCFDFYEEIIGAIRKLHEYLIAVIQKYNVAASPSLVNISVDVSRLEVTVLPSISAWLDRPEDGILISVVNTYECILFGLIDVLTTLRLSMVQVGAFSELIYVPMYLIGLENNLACYSSLLRFFNFYKMIIDVEQKFSIYVKICAESFAKMILGTKLAAADGNSWEDVLSSLFRMKVKIHQMSHKIKKVEILLQREDSVIENNQLLCSEIRSILFVIDDFGLNIVSVANSLQCGHVSNMKEDVLKTLSSLHSLERFSFLKYHRFNE